MIASEVGAIPVAFDDIAETGQLDPGEAIAVHLPERRVLRPNELRESVVRSTRINFAELSERRLVPLPRKTAAPNDPAAPAAPPKIDNAVLNLFGWTRPRERVVQHLAETGKEPVTSMGYDRPLPFFSATRPPLTKYFKQIVAVVTNPPIDPLREDGAFDMTVHLGASPTANEDAPVYPPLPQYRLASPILTADQFEQIRARRDPERPAAAVLDCTFEDPREGASTGAKAISRRIAELCRSAVGIVKRGEASILLLSDRAALDTRMSSPRLPLPMVLMTSALHNALVQEGRRRHACIAVETGEIQEGHDAAVFIANGANALFPYLFYMVGEPHGTAANLVHGLEETLRRVMSKMGICSVDGYRGSRLFEAVGLCRGWSSIIFPALPCAWAGSICRIFTKTS